MNLEGEDQAPAKKYFMKFAKLSIFTSFQQLAINN
jgi:hypothetical protein